jgi:pimeloyl-ACP methyl ester carboxylesterase
MRFFCLFLILSLQYVQAGTLEPCTIPEVEGKARCGFIEVPENREIADGRKIGIYVVVLSAFSEKPAPDPLWVIQGGPGQAGTKLADFYGKTFAEVRKTRDIVLFDQRGTGKSNGLKCEFIDPSASAAEYFVDFLPIERVKECKTKLEQGADLTQYTTSNGMHDVEDLRKALGYEKLNFYGTSYGTAAALVYMHQYPDRVRSVVLKAVAPLNTMRVSVTTAADAQTALDRVFQDCAADEQCNQAFPNLKAEFQTLTDRLRKEPATVEIIDPQTKNVSKVQFKMEHLGLTLRALLHAPDSSAKLPLMIHQAASGNLGPLAELSLLVRKQFQNELAFGMFLTVYCSEEIPFVTQEMIRKETANTFHGDYWVSQIAEACKVWPKGKVPDYTKMKIKSNAPVLLISGGLDPVTPPRWGEAAAKTLPNSRHFVIPQGGHSFNRMIGCVEVVIADFISKGSVDSLDFSCASKITRPAFALK